MAIEVLDTIDPGDFAGVGPGIGHAVGAQPPSGAGRSLAERVAQIGDKINEVIEDGINALPLTATVLATTSEKTIAGGVITITANLHTVDTEANAASDDLDTINGGTTGQVVFLYADNDARSIVFKHGTGNLICPYAKDVTLAEDDDLVMAVKKGSSWVICPLKLTTSTEGGIAVILALTTAGNGASLIGVQDSAGYIVAAQVEAALAELATVTSDVAYAVDGLHAKKVARATFNPTLNASERTIAAHGLGVTLPDKAILTRAWFKVVTTFTSATDAATLAVGLPTDGAGMIKAAIAISNGANPWDAGYTEGIQTGAASLFGVQLTAARELTITVAVEALLGGKLELYVEYVIGA